MCEKHMRKSIISSKDAGHCIIFYVKCHFSAGVLKYFTVASQVTGFLIGRTLVGIGLTKSLKLTAIKRTFIFKSTLNYVQSV